MAFIIDTSAFASVVIADERTALTPRIEQLLERERFIVPVLFRLELGNALLNALRKGRMTEEQISAIEALLARCNFEMQALETGFLLTEVNVAKAYGLSVYDATYLQLALKLNARLVTLDKTLAAAASAVGLLWMPDVSPLVVKRRSRAITRLALS